MIVRLCPQGTGHKERAGKHVGLENSNPQLIPYDGYFAAVSLASSEPLLLDLEGNLISLSQRFTGKEPLYRGNGFHIKYDDLKRIYVS